MCGEDKIDRRKREKHKERQEKTVREKRRLVGDNTHSKNWQWNKIRKE